MVVLFSLLVVTFMYYDITLMHNLLTIIYFSQVYVFAEADEFKKLTEPLQEVARKFKSKVITDQRNHCRFSFHCYNLISLKHHFPVQIMLVLVDIKEDNLAKPFLTLFGLEESEDIVVSFLMHD